MSKKKKSGYRWKKYIKKDMDNMFGPDAYAHNLNEEEKAWLRQFNDEYYNGNLYGAGEKIHTKEALGDNYEETKSEINKRKYDLETRYGIKGSNAKTKNGKKIKRCGKCHKCKDNSTTSKDCIEFDKITFCTINIMDHVYKSTDLAFDDFTKLQHEILEDNYNSENLKEKSEYDDLLEASRIYVKQICKTNNKELSSIKKSVHYELYMHNKMIYLYDLIGKEINDEDINEWLAKSIKQIREEYNTHINNKITAFEYGLLCKKRLDDATLLIEGSKKTTHDINQTYSLLKLIIEKTIYRGKNKNKIERRLKTIKLTYKKERSKKRRKKK